MINIDSKSADSFLQKKNIVVHYIMVHEFVAIDVSLSAYINSNKNLLPADICVNNERK